MSCNHFTHAVIRQKTLRGYTFRVIDAALVTSKSRVETYGSEKECQQFVEGRREFSRMPDYQAVSYSSLVDYDEIETFLGRELSEAEELALYNNKEDQKMAEMGR